MPISQEEFIRRINEKYNYKYDTSLAIYKGQYIPVELICPKHGNFTQIPKLLYRGNGCRACGIENKSKAKRTSKAEFISKSKDKFGDSFRFDNIEYKNEYDTISLTCLKHNHSFKTTPKGHLTYINGGCKFCWIENAREKRKDTKEIFESKAIETHGKKYDYSNVIYQDSQTEVSIICPEHGEFLQKPAKHICGQGCPICKSSHLETDIRLFLQSNKMIFIEQYNKLWLGLQTLDFYLPEYNIAIECQGEQHFLERNNFGSKTNVHEITKQRDQRKLQKCQEHGVTILYYSNLGIEYPYHVFEDKEELLQEILRHKPIYKEANRT